MKNKKILLVGGCGFIGHNLAINLAKRGHSPIIADSLSINSVATLTIVRFLFVNSSSTYSSK